MRASSLKRVAPFLKPAFCGMAARPLIAAGIAFACVAGPAFGADLPPSETPPVFTWTGFYAGFNNGYAWRGSGAFNTAAVNLFDSPAIPALPPHLFLLSHEI
jgi:hypothetical protein